MTDEQRNIECTKLLTIVHELDRMIRAEIARNDQMRAQIAALIAIAMGHRSGIAQR